MADFPAKAPSQEVPREMVKVLHIDPARAGQFHLLEGPAVFVVVFTTLQQDTRISCALIP
jgi:hypothetical protein